MIYACQVLSHFLESSGCYSGSCTLHFLFYWNNSRKNRPKIVEMSFSRPSTLPASGIHSWCRISVKDWEQDPQKRQKRPYMKLYYSSQSVGDWRISGILSADYRETRESNVSVTWAYNSCSDAWMWPMRNERAAESGNAILKIRPAKIYLSIECKKRVQAPNKRNQSESEFGSVLRTSREAVRDTVAPPTGNYLWV